MTRVLAFIDDSAAAVGVLRAAESIAHFLGATTDAINVTRSGDVSPSVLGYGVRTIQGEPRARILEELAANDVGIGVLGSRAIRSKPTAIGHVASAVMASSPRPVLLVPPDNREMAPDRPRLLLPLDGTNETDRALSSVTRGLVDAGAVLSVVHVYDSDSVPPFIESTYDLDVLAEQFRHQHLQWYPERCALRIGDPAQVIVELAAAEEIDCVLVAWQQDLSPGRADVIQRLLREARVPLLLVPSGSDLVATQKGDSANT